MKHQKVRRRPTARVLPVLLVAFAFIAAFLPSSLARQQSAGGRPRRTNVAPQATPTPAQKTHTPGQVTTSAAPRQTPTPAPTSPAAPGTTGGVPKLQTSPVTKADEKTEQEKEQEVDNDEVVKVESNLVNLQVRVVDRNNRPLPDVGKNDFQVFENGVLQKIEFITTEEVPISYGLVIDNSGSLRHQINEVIDAGKTIISSNKPGDESFVIRFVGSDNIKIMQDFTPNKQALDDALDDMFVEGGQTAVIDAVYLGAEYAANHKTGSALDDKRRHALVLVTDGEDRASVYKTEQLFESLKEEDVQIFIIGFVNELEKEGGFISKSKRSKAMDLLNRMAKETGGRAFYPSSLTELPGISQEITKDLRTQYVISYIPTTKARPGEYRPVRVAVADTPNREKRIAVTRSGYTARGGNATPPMLDRPQSPRRP